MSIPTSLAVESSSIESPQPCRRLTFSEIQVATQNFDESLVVGHGGFGKVYKGTITYGESLFTVAIKRLDSTSNQGAEEFWAEVEILSKLRHSHLVSLIGYCNDVRELMLVYEYMPNGTLSDRLHKGKAPLTWVRRLKICLGAARGLEYLHTTMSIKPIVIHRDVKSSNILLDDNSEAKVSDFGLSKEGPTDQPSTICINTLVRGTFGYLDPDYYNTGRLTRKSDVYAFGVVMFEVLCGKQAVDRSLDEDQWGLASWAHDSIKERKLKHIVDPNIRGTISPKCLKAFAQLANQCLHSNRKQRPTMTEIVVGVETVLALQEKTNKTLLPTNKKIFGRKVPTFLIPSNRENPVGSLKSLDMYLYTIEGEDRKLRRFDFKTIDDATANFSQANKAVGGFIYLGVYKGRLQSGQHITIVPYGPSGSVGEHEECMDEASIHVKVEHDNLLQLLGYCVEGGTVYLVYDFAPYARLDRLIFDPNYAPLEWNARYKIILGVARALVYLHNHAPVRIIHGDVKPSNIWLAESLDPKLFGFRFAMSKAINATDEFKTEKIRGTSAYMAPELVLSGHMSTKTDVFSFGMVVLETITWQNLHDNTSECMKMLPEYVWRNWMEGTCLNIIDPRINIDGNISSIKKLIHIGLLCVQHEAANRPTMEETVTMMLGCSSAPLPIPKKPSTMIYNDLDVRNSKSLDMYLYTIGGKDRMLRRFDLKTIVDATENFSQANKLVDALFYPSLYKGRLQNGQHITIVQHGPDASIRDYKERIDEASMHVQVEHDNLLQLLGYCVEGSTVYLVYDFAPYARLDRLIFDPERAPVDWYARYKIILGVARALVYIHNHAPARIIHCDVKPSNILLDESLEPKLFGFHFAMSKAINETDNFKMEITRGSIAYMAPEVWLRNHVSTKADVFSFGVLVLVTINARKAFDITHETLPKYAWRNWKEGTCSNMIDPIISIDGNMSSITKLIHIGLLCVQREATDRPTMEEVVAMLLGSSSASLRIPKEPPFKNHFVD